jgi:hypothetical protein
MNEETKVLIKKGIDKIKEYQLKIVIGVCLSTIVCPTLAFYLKGDAWYLLVFQVLGFTVCSHFLFQLHKKIKKLKARL